MFYERIEMTCRKNAWLIEWKVKDLEVSQKNYARKMPRTIENEEN